MVGDKRNVNRSNTEMKRNSVAPVKKPKTASFAPNTKLIRPQTANIRGNSKPKFQYQTKSMQNNRFVQELIDASRYERKIAVNYSSPKKSYLDHCQGKQAIKGKEIELKVVGLETSLSPRAMPKLGRFTTSYQMFSVAGLKGTERIDFK